MLSTKSFRDLLPSSIAEAQSWLQVFIADISSRLEDEGVMSGRRRPKTMTLSFSNKAGSRNKQLSIPAAGKVDRDLLLKLAESLLRTVAGEPCAFPCTSMSLQVGGLEDREEGNMDIGAFLLMGQQAKNANKRASEERATSALVEEKRRRLDGGTGRFFAANEEEDKQMGELATEDEKTSVDAPVDGKRHNADGSIGHFFAVKEAVTEKLEDTHSEVLPNINTSASAAVYDDPSMLAFHCPDCSADIVGEEEEHKDWHFAKALAQEDKAVAARGRRMNERPTPGSSKGRRGGGKKKGGRKDSKMEKGQSVLRF
jgi:DNA polymerase eta